MEKLKIFESKLARLALVGGMGALALVGCSGQHNPPTEQEVQDGVEYIQITRPDGTPMECVMYAEEGSSGYAGYSWFSLDCDWDTESR